MKTKTYNVYSFDELSEKAKRRAIEEHRDFISQKWDAVCTIDDCKKCLSFLGFNIEKVYYSGFYSQGDGACFDGSFYTGRVDPTGLEEYAPTDITLSRWAKELIKYPLISFTVRHYSNHYFHEKCTEFEFSKPGEHEEKLKDLAREAMRWIYNRLKADYEWSCADEQIIESIKANEYEFREDGKID